MNEQRLIAHPMIGFHEGIRQIQRMEFPGGTSRSQHVCILTEPSIHRKSTRAANVTGKQELLRCASRNIADGSNIDGATLLEHRQENIAGFLSSSGSSRLAEHFSRHAVIASIVPATVERRSPEVSFTFLVTNAAFRDFIRIGGR